MELWRLRRSKHFICTAQARPMREHKNASRPPAPSVQLVPVLARQVISRIIKKYQVNTKKKNHYSDWAKGTGEGAGAGWTSALTFFFLRCGYFIFCLFSPFFQLNPLRPPSPLVRRLLQVSGLAPVCISLPADRWGRWGWVAGWGGQESVVSGLRYPHCSQASGSAPPLHSPPVGSEWRPSHPSQSAAQGPEPPPTGGRERIER